MTRYILITAILLAALSFISAQSEGGGNESELFPSTLNFTLPGSPMFSASYGLEQIDLVNGFGILTAEAGTMSIGSDLQQTTVDATGIKNQQFAVFPTGSSFFSLNSLAFQLDGIGTDDVNSTVFYGDGPNTGMGGAVDFNTQQAGSVNIENGLVLESGKQAVVNESSGAYFDDDVIIMWSPGDGFGTGSRILSIWEEDSAAERWFLDGSGNPSSFSPSGSSRSNQKSLAGNMSKVNTLNAFSYVVDQEKLEGGSNQETTLTRIGLDAAELERVIPEAVSTNPNGDKFISYNTVIPVLIEALKEVDAKQAGYDALEAEVTDLRSQVAELKKLVKDLASN